MLSPEISEQGLQERRIHASPSYTFHPYGLPFARLTDLYCAEKGLMTWSMNMLLKIYSPALCVYKNYHKIVMFPPDWKILLSCIIFSHSEPYAIIQCFIDPACSQFDG